MAQPGPAGIKLTCLVGSPTLGACEAWCYVQQLAFARSAGCDGWARDSERSHDWAFACSSPRASVWNCQPLPAALEAGVSPVGNTGPRFCVIALAFAQVAVGVT